MITFAPVRFPSTALNVLAAIFILAAPSVMADQSEKTAASPATPSAAARDVEAAEQELRDAKEDRSPGATETRSSSHPAAWTPELVCKLSLGIGTFALLSFIIVAFLIWKNKRAEQILRTFGILVIIFAAVFLVVAGYSDAQITPVIGLLGTVAGYLLGRRIEETKDSKHDTEQR